MATNEPTNPTPDQPAPQASPASPSIRATHARMALLLLVLTLLPCLGANLAARTEWAERLVYPKYIAQCQRDPWKRFVPHPHGIEDSEYFLLSGLQDRDYARGGVVLLGASNLKFNLQLYKIPSSQRRLVRDFTFGWATHKQQWDLVRYLSEDRDLLSAKPGKLMVVIGAFFGSGAQAWWEGETLRHFKGVITRYDFYDYDPGRGILPTDMNPVERWFDIQRFLGRAALRFRPRDLVARPEKDHPNLPKYTGFWRKNITPGWQATMDRQVAQFEEMVEHLQRHGAKVVVVYTPLPTWLQNLEYTPAYKQRIDALCRRRNLPTLDLANFLDDGSFTDHIHTNFGGGTKTHAEIMKIIQPHLDEISSSGKE